MSGQPVPGPASTPSPGSPRARQPISSEQLQAWITVRQRTRRKLVAVFVVVAGLVGGGLAVIWTIFHQHLIAQGHLRGLGFVVDWDINPENLSTGGTTEVGFRSRQYDYDGRVTARDLESLKSLRHVRTLSLMGLNRFSDDELAVVAGLGELTELDLDRSPTRFQSGNIGNLLTDRVLDHVEGLTRLKILGLGANRITDAGLVKLAKLQALESLDLDGTAVTDKGLNALVGLKALKMLRLENTRVTPEGLSRFQQKRPGVEVIYDSAPMDMEKFLR